MGSVDLETITTVGKVGIAIVEFALDVAPLLFKLFA